MWCEPEFHRDGHGKMFMENKDNESLKLSAKMVDLEDAEEFLKGSSAGKEKIINAASNKGTESFFTEVTATKEREKIQKGAGCFPVPQVKGYCIV